MRSHRPNIKIEVERFDADIKIGLNNEQVEKRVQAGLTNKSSKKYSKSYLEIILSNVVTFFNILLIIIAIAQFSVGYYQGCFFLVIMFANMFIGLVQDIRAKKIIEKMRLETAPTAVVIRDGVEKEISSKDVVIDDIIKLSSGKNIPTDGIVVDGEIEVNEALLTGESIAVKKRIGDSLLAGSYVVSGNGIFKAVKVGKDNYIEQLQAKAKTFKRPKSELLLSLNKILRIISYFIIPLGALLFFVNYRQSKDIAEVIKYTSGALVGMIPSGMFLLTSMTLAVGVIRLALKKTLVQELYSIEMLARVNTICFDKTGTLTDGTMKVKDVKIFDAFEGIDIDSLMGAFLKATGDLNQTALALKEKFPYVDSYTFVKAIPFSSERKYSAVEFKEYGTFVLGAYEFVHLEPDDKTKNLVESLSKKGLRVLMLSYSKKRIKNDCIPSTTSPVALFVIQDHIREEAYDTIKWFNDNDVEAKIISGDNPVTVAEIANQCGVKDAYNYINLEGMPLEQVKEVADKYVVFGRVNPDQKATIVETLQEKGRTVAMTGDGVNDILALKHADCSIAMASGSEATRNVSHLVLMDSNFAHMPNVVEEGRRVINNLQNTCSLFLAKTTFSVLMSLIFIFIGLFAKNGGEYTYPFVTGHLYIWETFAIGIASFFLALQPNKNRIKGGFVDNVLLRALPGGITIVLATSVALLSYYLPNLSGVSNENIQITVAVLVMSLLSFVVLFRVCWPFNTYRIILFLAMAILASGAVLLATYLWVYQPIELPNIFEIFIEQMNFRAILTTLIIVVVAIPIYFLLDRLFNKLIIKKHLKVSK